MKEMKMNHSNNRKGGDFGILGKKGRALQLGRWLTCVLSLLSSKGPLKKGKRKGGWVLGRRVEFLETEFHQLPF